MTLSCTTLSEDIALLKVKTKELRVLSDELLTEGVALTENIRARFHVLRAEAQAIDSRIKETLLYLERDPIAIESALAQFGFQGYKDVTEVNGVPYYLAFQNVEGKFVYSYVTRKGQRLNEETYQNVGTFSDGRARVIQDEQWFFITEDGTPLGDGRYEVVGNFSDGRARVMQDGGYFFITEDGTPLSTERYDRAWDFSGGRAQVKQGNDEFAINRSEKRIDPITTL
jgi:hypothetical protein